MLIGNFGGCRGPADKSHSPFPFERLPPEIRNEIYKLVAVSNENYYFGYVDHRVKGHTEGLILNNDFLNVQRQSAVFRVSRQTRAEGLALFYQYHHFLLSVEHGGCFLAIVQWLRNIGPFWRSHIRHLEIRYQCRSSALDTSVIGRISRYIGGNATVVYSAEGLSLVKALWRTRQYFLAREPSAAPGFRIVALGQGGVIHEDLDHDFNRPNWHFIASCSWSQGTMTFYPRAQ